MDTQENEFGERVKELRENKALTQLQLSEMLKVSLQSVRDWERGRQFPHMRKLPSIAKALGVEVGALFRSVVAPSQWPSGVRDQIVTAFSLKREVETIEKDLKRVNEGVFQLRASLKKVWEGQG